MFDINLLLPFLAALGCGLVAGVLFAFSSFVMPALNRLDPSQSIAAMQSINVTVINVSFMGTFFGTGVLCVVIAMRSYFVWQRPGAGLAVAGALLYLLGTIAVTAAFHVPRNDALAAVSPGADSAEVWRQYATAWTAGNHVRAAAAFVAGGLLTLSLLVRQPTP